MNISAKGVKRNNFTPKSLEAGVVEARITSIKVETVAQPRDPKVPEYKVLLGLEGRPMPEGFEGWDKDKNDPSKGKYKGQFSTVTHDRWNIKDFSFTKNGKTVSVDSVSQIIRIFQEIAEALGRPELLEGTVYQKSFKSWNEFIKQFYTDLQYNKHYLFFTLGGSKTKNASGHTVTYLSLAPYKLLENKPRIGKTKEDVAPFTPDMVHVNEKAFAMTPNNVSDEEADTEFNEDEAGEFGNTSMGHDDDDATLFENDGDDDFDTFEEVDDDLPL